MSSSTNTPQQQQKLIEHIVFFTLPNLTPETELSFHTSANSLKSLPGIKELHFAKAQHIAEEKQNGYTHVLRGVFESKGALESYLGHEKHLEFVALLRQNGGLEKPLTVMDFERDAEE